jgi:hypothetical protein
MLTQAEARRIWKQRVLEKSKIVDPDDEHDWDTLCFGFLLGLGYWSVAECRTMVLAFTAEGLL